MSPRVLLVTLTTLASAGSLPAAIWSSPGWALSSDVDLSTGYDSNLDYAKNGDSSAYISAVPTFSFVRRNSSSQIDFGANLTHVEFIGSGLESETFGGFTFRYAYPYADGTRPFRTLSASAQRNTIADAYLGRRIDIDNFSLRGTSRVYYTGKLGVNVEAGFQRIKYLLDQLDTNDEFSGVVGVGYDLSPLTTYSVNLKPSYSISKPNTSGRSSVKSREVSLNGRVEGELLPKLKGFAFAGMATASYSGVDIGSDIFPVAGTGLTWQATPAGTLNLAVDLGAGFSPKGDVTRRRGVTAIFTQGVYSDWRVNFTAGALNIDYPSVATGRTDTSYNGGLSVTYNYGSKLQGDLGYTYSTQSSDFDLNNYNRHHIQATLSYHF